MKNILLFFIFNSLAFGFNSQKVELPKIKYSPVSFIECKGEGYFFDLKNIYGLADENRWRKLFSLTKRSEHFIKSVCSNGNIYSITNRGLYNFSGFLFEKVKEFNDEKTRDIVKGTWGDIFVLTDKNIYLYSSYGIRLLKKLPKGNWRKIAVYKKRMVLTGSDKIAVFNNGKIEIMKRNIGFADIKYIKDLNAFVYLKNGKENGFKKDDGLHGYIYSIKNPLKIVVGDERWGVVSVDGIKIFKLFDKILEVNCHPIDLFLNRRKSYILNDKNINIIYSNESNSDKNSYVKICKHKLPAVEDIIKNSESLKYLPLQRSKKWMDNVRKRGWIPKVTLNFGYSFDNGYYVNRSDNISISTTYQRVIVGPPEYTRHNDNGSGYDLSLSLSWQLDRLLYDDQELSVAYRLTDLMHEKNMVVGELINTYEEIKLYENRCCNGDYSSCIEAERRIELLKYYTGYSKELWKK